MSLEKGSWSVSHQGHLLEKPVNCRKGFLLNFVSDGSAASVHGESHVTPWHVDEQPLPASAHWFLRSGLWTWEGTALFINHTVNTMFQEEARRNLHGIGLQFPSSASPAPHGNTASIPTEGHDLHWHLYVTVPATRYPLGGSFVHTGTYVPTTLFCCKSPTEVTPPSCWQRLVTQFRLILNSPRPGSPGMPQPHPLIPLLTIPVSQTVQPRKPPLVPTTCPLLFLLTWWAW